MVKQAFHARELNLLIYHIEVMIYTVARLQF